MRPCELLQFYMPWPARLNSNIEEARTHSKTWAGELGMLEPGHGRHVIGAWSEHEFTSMDYAVLTAFTHPDAAPAELNLLTDWYVWASFFDRHVVEKYHRSSDVDGAKNYLTRLSAFIPIDLADGFPAPTNSVERGLADLWARTAPRRSADWRARFARSTQRLLEGSLWERANISQNRVPNPIGYVQMRRKVGGAPWSADLVEHATGTEIPPEIAHTRSMRVLRHAFADGVHLRRDIFAYQRDTNDRSALNNCVYAVEVFFGCTSQEAADLVNNLLTSRLYQFENSVLSQLPAVLDQYNLAATAREQVLGYVKGLQDWQAGSHEWHIRSIRNPNFGSRRAPPGRPGAAA